MDDIIKNIANRKLSRLVIMGKNSTNGLMIKTNMSFDSDFIEDDVELKVVNVFGVSSLELDDLRKNNPKVFYDKVIDVSFCNSLINSYQVGNNSILPPQFKRFCDNVICFKSSDFEVYFTDDTIYYFNEVIEKLKSRRVDDTYMYCKDIIKNGNVNHISVNLVDDSSITGSDIFVRKKDYGVGLQKKLIYNISKTKDCSYDNGDIKNIEKIVDFYIDTNGSIGRGEFDLNSIVMNNSLVFSLNGFDSVPELRKDVLSKIVR